MKIKVLIYRTNIWLPVLLLGNVGIAYVDGFLIRYTYCLSYKRKNLFWQSVFCDWHCEMSGRMWFILFERCYWNVQHQAFYMLGVFFPVILILTKKKILWMCAEVVASVTGVKGASKRSIVQGKWGDTQENF